MTPRRHTSHELADELGLKINKLAVWRMEGFGPRFVKLGDGSRAAVRYRRNDVDNWLNQRIRKSTSDEGSDCEH